MAAVQFYGIAAVLSAYERREVAPWSIWSGRQFLFKCEDTNLATARDELEETLQMISQNPNSSATYTLKVYEELPKDKKIKSTTPDDGSFNFKFFTVDEANQRFIGYGERQNNNALLSEVNALKAKVAELEALNAEDDIDESEPDVWEKINGLLEKPAVIGALNKLLGIDLSKNRPATVGTAPGQNDELIEKALNVLRDKDELLGQHLWKLATMAINKPDNFRFLLSTLDQME